MERPSEGLWSEDASRPTLEGQSTSFHGTPFAEPNPHPSFVDAAFPAADSTSNFLHSDSFSHPVSLAGSYDSLPFATSQLYEVSSNDSSAVSGSILTDTLASSSVTSSFTGTRHDSFSDEHSRKASLGSIHDGSYNTSLVRSPEVDETSSIASATPSWPAGVIRAQQNASLSRFGYHSAANPALSATSFYTSSPVTAGSSHGISPYSYPDAIPMMAPGSLPSFPPDQLANARSFQSAEFTAPLSASSSFPNQPMTTLPISGGPAKGAKAIRSSSNGSTRRAKFRRSRTGCMVCRKRKVKCDQDGQPCKQCRIGKRECHYEESPPKRKRKSKGESESPPKRKDSTDEVEASLQDRPLESAAAASVLSSVGSVPDPLAREQSKEIDLHEGDNDERRRRAEEAAEELNRATDALFAQHTNLDDVERDEDEVSKVDHIIPEKQNGDSMETFSALHFAPSEGATSKDVADPWTTGSDRTASMTEDWSTTTSSGPSSNRTIDGESLEATFANLASDNVSGHKGRFESPFEQYIGLEEHTASTLETDVPWYQGSTGSRPESIRGPASELVLGVAGGLLGGVETAMLTQQESS